MEIYCFLYPHGKPFHIPIALELEGDDDFELGIDEYLVGRNRDIPDDSDNTIGGHLERIAFDEEGFIGDAD
jgi:hypothetical protein